MSEKLGDAEKAVLDTIADIKTGPWEASAQSIGFVMVRDRKAQVQVRVTLDESEWIDG